MAITANIGLEILTEGQANKEASITASHEMLDSLVQAAVIDRDLTMPPGAPSEGDVYLVAASGSGDWTGQDGKIAHFRNNAWAFITPREGWRLYVRDEDVFIIYDGSNWSAIGGTITVKETDGTPVVSEVTTIAVTNGKLTDDGGGQVTLDLSGGSSASLIAGFQGIWEQIDRREFSGVSTVTIGGAQTPGDFDAYILMSFIVLSADAAIDIWASTDGGSSKITNYANAGTANGSGGGSAAFGSEILATLSSSNIADADASNFGICAEVKLWDPNSSIYKGALIHSQWNNASGAQLDAKREHVWVRETSAINALIMEPSNGAMTGTAVLLGLKKSETKGRLVEDPSLARTLTDDDNNRLIHFTNAGSGILVTLPASLAVGFACRLINDTGGAITLSGSGGLTVLGDTSLAQTRIAEISRIANTKASVVVM